MNETNEDDEKDTVLKKYLRLLRYLKGDGLMKLILFEPKFQETDTKENNKI